MRKVINSSNVRLFAYVNDAVCNRPVKGIAVEFMGLGGQSQYNEETPMGLRMAEQGILLVVPYLNPWAWMNPQAVRMTDEIVEAVMKRCGLEDIPVISSGGSMGGQQALTYARYAGRTPVACVVNCPVCDLPYHYTERPDLPRTLYSAYGMSDADTIEEAMEKASPLHLALAGEMPKIQYVLFHCEKDEAVNKQQHSDRFVKAMGSEYGIEYYAVPNRGHCDLTDEMRALYEAKIAEAAR